MISKHPEIFISYSWNDDGLRVADEIEQFFQRKGIAVMRDSRAIGYKGLIKEYMQRLGRGKCVILVLSDQYFKSPNCMYELLEIAKDQDFEKRVFPVPFEGFTYNNREKYVTYWDEQKTRLQEEIRQFLNLAHREGSINKINLYEDIRCKISDLLERLSDLNTYPLQQGGNYEPLLQAIQANMPTAELDYSRLPINFSPKIEFLTRYFVGRQDAIARIDRFIQTHKSGYLAIVGEAGIGKSALLAHEVKKRNAVHHFVDDKWNSDKDEVFLRSIVGQLQQQYGLEFEERTPISVSEWNIYLHKWIKEISAEEKLVIFVDALDEAQHYGGSDNLLKYLPPELPENVYFILSSRPEFKKEDITFFTSTIFETYELAPLTQADIETYLVQRNISKQTSETAKIIWEKSEGNPLYLYYLFQDFDGKNLTLEQISQLPQGLMKFYEKQWRERIWIGDKATKEGRKQLLCLLLILKEPPDENMLLALTDFDRAELQDYLTPLRRFMRVGERYAIFHDSFKNFLQYQFEKSISLYHEKLIEDLWNWRELEGDVFRYALYWLPMHLSETGKSEKLQVLLEDVSFIEMKVNQCSVSAIQHDFLLLSKKTTSLLYLQRSLLRQASIIDEYPEFCIAYLYNYLWGAYPRYAQLWSEWFRTAFNNSPYLPRIYLKRLNHCIGRIDEAFFFRFKGHSDAIKTAAFSPNGQFIVSGSEDQTLKLWDVTTGKMLRTFEGHTSGVNAVAFSPTGQHIISGSHDQTLKLWDITSGKLIQTFKGHTSGVNAVAYSPDGQCVISGSDDQTLKLWDIVTGKILRVFESYDSEVTAVAYSQDGQYIISGYKNRLLKLWNVRTGKNVETFKRYVGKVNSVAFSPDSCCIICGSFEGMLTLWHIDNPGQAIRHFQDTAFSPSVAFSPDGQKVVAGSFNGMLTLSDVCTGDSLKTFEGHTSTVWTVTFSPDGQQIISGSGDHTLILWDTEAENNVDMPPQSRSFEIAMLIEFSPDGRFMISVTEDKTLILWNVDTGKSIKTFEGHSSWIRAVSFSSDSQFMISGDDDGFVKLWDIPRRQLIETFQVHFPGITALAISPDSQHIISGGRDGILILWNIRTKQVIRVFEGHADRIDSVIFASNGQYIVSGSNDQTLKLWHINKDQVIRTFNGHTEKILAVAFSPDGQHIISGSIDHTLKLWDIDTKHAIKTFEGHSSGVVTVAFSQNGCYIVSGSIDHTFRLWNAKIGKNISTNCPINISTFVGESPIICARFSSNGKEILIADNYRAPRIYRFEIVKRDA